MLYSTKLGLVGKRIYGKTREMIGNMEKEESYMQEIADGYRPDVERLIKYIPWLETMKGNDAVSGTYSGQGIAEHSITIPVYDGNLLNLVKDARQTQLMDRNYAYVYSRNKIRTVAEEQRYIDHATIRQMEGLKGILSKYILGGMTRGAVWVQGVTNGSILKVLVKMKEILDYWERR